MGLISTRRRRIGKLVDIDKEMRNDLKADKTRDN